MKLPIMIFFLAIGIVYFIDYLIRFTKKQEGWTRSIVIAGACALMVILISVMRIP